MTNAAILLGNGNHKRIYPQEIRDRLERHCTLLVEGNTQDLQDLLPTLEPVEVLFTGWGGPKLTSEVLDAMPNLKLVLYGAGSLKSIATDDFWTKQIPICSAWVANAVPVAEFTFAQIILALKQVHRFPGLMRKAKAKDSPEYFEAGGAFHTTVSLISLGQIGKFVAKLLQNLDVNVLAYDPFIDPEEAQRLGVTLVSLEEAFAQGRVVSLHTPWLPETEGMITGDLLRLIPKGGAFINTARGAVVKEKELIEVLQERSDLSALLDVTYPEPPEPDSPLFTLENVFLTPHIAGSVAGECGRMGQFMVDELCRYQKGEPLKYQVSKAAFQRMA